MSAINPEDQIEGFVNSQKRSEWLTLTVDRATIKLYLRKAQHWCGPAVVKTLDIATVDAYPQGTGAFTRIVKAVERIAHERQYTVFAESVSNERLVEFFLKRGYVWQNEPHLGYSMYKVV